MSYQHVSVCPRCGAPIYEEREKVPLPPAGMGTDPFGGKPSAYFTCECRKALPAPLPDLDGDALETTVQADQKHLARNRAAAPESGSEERVDE